MLHGHFHRYSRVDDDGIPCNNDCCEGCSKVVIFVHKDLVKTKWGADRHDLLAYLVKDIFHLSNSLGLQMEIVSSREGVTDTDYCTRTLQFEMTTPNSVQPFNTNKYERNSIIDRKDKVLHRQEVGEV